MIVLDTQAWLWWLHDPSRLTKKASRLLEKAEREGGMCVSVISVWEVAVKHSLGKLQLPLDVDEWYRLASQYPNIVIEPLLPWDAIASTQLPGDFHRDPADRIIVALSRRLKARLVTADRKIQSYSHVTTVW
jgi:PIN domain nuclease of toxin-antitoxin system